MIFSAKFIGIQIKYYEKLRKENSDGLFIKIIDEVAVSQVNENIEEIIKKSIPEIEEKNILKIIDVRNESKALIDFHNNMRKSFGNELGRKM